MAKRKNCVSESFSRTLRMSNGEELLVEVRVSRLTDGGA
jgi:hypothetical protein